MYNILCYESHVSYIRYAAGSLAQREQRKPEWLLLPGERAQHIFRSPPSGSARVYVTQSTFSVIYFSSLISARKDLQSGFLKHQSCFSQSGPNSYSWWDDINGQSGKDSLIYLQHCQRSLSNRMYLPTLLKHPVILRTWPEYKQFQCTASPFKLLTCTMKLRDPCFLSTNDILALQMNSRNAESTSPLNLLLRNMWAAEIIRSTLNW